MASRIDQIDIAPETIGNALKIKTLWVPANQRDYSWKDKHVDDLYDDLYKAIDKRAAEYFLGSIVAIKDIGDDRLYVVDGQQRLATALILLAAIRDFHEQKGQVETAKTFQGQYILTEHYLKPDQPAPHLFLNERDRDYFFKRVQLPPSDPRRIAVEAPPRRASTKPPKSHKLIDKAAKIAKRRIEDITKGTSIRAASAVLDRWVEFLMKNAKVIWVQVPDESAAYLIFETMNDRGLELSASDLIKNLLFGRGGSDNLETIKMNWTLMVGALDTVAGIEVKDYIRHYWISRHGVTRSSELFDELREHVQNESEAVETADALAKAAQKYVALSTPSHVLWNRYSGSAKASLKTLSTLGIEQTRPLLLAALEKFGKKELEKLLPMTVAWSVRLLISGKQGTGQVETAYGNAAEAVATGRTKTASEVAQQVTKAVPNDQQFEAAFAEATVSKGVLARYLLRAMNKQMSGEKDPFLCPDEEPGVNLEHIMPEDREYWMHIPSEEHEDHLNRLGNLALMQVQDNSVADKDKYEVKRPILRSSRIPLTKGVAQKFDDWRSRQIEEWQAEMSKVAVRTWPLKK